MERMKHTPVHVTGLLASKGQVPLPAEGVGEGVSERPVQKTRKQQLLNCIGDKILS